MNIDYVLSHVPDDHASSSRSVSIASHPGPSPLSMGMTTAPPTAPSPSSQSLSLPHGSPGETDDTDNDSASDPTSDYHSFSDSDTEGDEPAMTEEERRLEHEMRAAERHLVLEAAGIVVKQDTTRRPPPRLQRRRSLTGVRPRHRPAPAPPSPIAPVPINWPDLDKPQPPTPTQAHIDDAYERYEAFKQHTFRLSVSSIEQLPDQDRGKDSVNPSVSYGSRITQLLARARTPIQEREARVMPTISAPILNTSSSGKGIPGTSSREDNPAFGSVCVLMLPARGISR
jgi:actin cytoskeleton-regulatory complex protein PAN1